MDRDGERAGTSSVRLGNCMKLSSITIKCNTDLVGDNGLVQFFSSDILAILGRVPGPLVKTYVLIPSTRPKWKQKLRKQEAKQKTKSNLVFFMYISQFQK